MSKKNSKPGRPTDGIRRKGRINLTIDPEVEDFLDELGPHFNVSAYVNRSLWAKFRKRKNVKDVDLIKYAHSYIRGIDFNPDLAKVSKMHMVLYDDGHTGIFSANSLEQISNIKKVASESGVPDVDYGAFDLILTNPPFGSRGKVTDKRILYQFDLGHKWDFKEETKRWEKTKNLAKGQVPDILFIERCLQLLRDNGRLGIVLPNSDLNNSSLEYVRQFIKENARILAVVSLPVGTFMSSGSNPQPSILFLQKLDKEEATAINEKNYPIFMASIDKIGYDLNTKTAPIIYMKDENGDILRNSSNEPIIDTEIPEVVEAFKNFRQRNGIKFRKTYDISRGT